MDLPTFFTDVFPAFFCGLVMTLICATSEPIGWMRRGVEVFTPLAVLCFTVYFPPIGYGLAWLCSFGLLAPVWAWRSQYRWLLWCTVAIYLAFHTLVGFIAGGISSAISEVYRTYSFQPVVADPVPWPPYLPELKISTQDSGNLGTTGTILTIAQPAKIEQVRGSLLWLCRRFHRLDQLQTIDIRTPDQPAGLWTWQVRDRKLSDLAGHRIDLAENWCGHRRSLVID